MAGTTIRDAQEALKCPRCFESAIYVLQSNEEELIPQTKGQVFQKRRIEVCPKPTLDWPLGLVLQMNTSSLPALGKLSGCFDHVNVIHAGYSTNAFSSASLAS